MPEQQGWPRNWQHPAAERGLCALQIVAQKGRTRYFVPFHVAWGNTERDRIWVMMPGCELLSWRGERRHTENRCQQSHPKRQLPSLSGYFIRNELFTINEGWPHVNLTLCCCCLNKNPATPKHCRGHAGGAGRDITELWCTGRSSRREQSHRHQDKP